MSQQFCLKWNNHMNNMMDVFKNLLSTEAMVDVTLACDGLSLKAHKIVLSACSPFFQSLFLENPCKHPIVILKDMKYTELKAIIEFMYHGEVNVAQEQLSALMKTAETLRVKGLAEVTNEKDECGDESSRKSSSRAGTPPPKRRKGRTRKRSVSDQSDEGVPQPKTEQPDSDIEELSSDMDHSTRYSSASTTVPLQSRAQSSHKSQQVQQQPVEASFASEESYSIEPPKLLQQTLTTDDLPLRSSRSSVQSNMEVLRRPQSSLDHSSNLVPVTSSPMSSSALAVSNQQPESPPDIKPDLLDLEPPSSPVAGPSHATDENSMMYMDQSNMSSMSGPTSFQDDSSMALVPSDSQPQEKRAVSESEKKVFKKIFKNPHLTIEKPASSDDIIEMTFAIKTEPIDEETESEPSSLTVSNLQISEVKGSNLPSEGFVSTSVVRCHKKKSRIQETDYTESTKRGGLCIIQQLLQKPFTDCSFDEKLKIVRSGRPCPELPNLTALYKDRKRTPVAKCQWPMNGLSSQTDETLIGR